MNVEENDGVPAEQVIDALVVQIAELTKQNAVLTVLVRQLQEGGH